MIGIDRNTGRTIDAFEQFVSRVTQPTKVQRLPSKAVAR